MNVLLRAAGILYSLYVLVVFVAIMLVLLPFVTGASLMGKIKGGNIIYRLCSFWADAWFLLIGIVHRNIYESAPDRNAHYIFVANHLSYLDAPVIVKSVRQPVRVLGKVELANIQLFGYIYRKAIITVDRSSAANKANSVRTLRSVLRRNISIFIFPEGTFNETERPLKDFFDGAFRLAIETGTAVKPMIFLDTYNRMHYRSVFSLRPGRSRTVFLPPVEVEGLTMRDVNTLKQRVYAVMEQALIRYNAAWIRERTFSAS